ncbi:hypothetical protein Vadar_017029 [Vaccinium darrowii]|uniref:Uncharacterized protein n=1 Tax=Vaccinium darrowii TaxID=229202 RepID=A0ACB7YW80_9ERIC|nr:hypothetical protein Vadar_017029 [Vaccinium darrowii]
MHSTADAAAEAQAQAINPLKRSFEVMNSKPNSTDTDNFRPREYQTKLFQIAMRRNTIAVLDTGAGKTLISVMIIKDIAPSLNLSPPQKKKLIIFLAPTVHLVHQGLNGDKLWTSVPNNAFKSVAGGFPLIVRRANRVVPRKKMAGGIKVNVNVDFKCSAPALNAMPPAPANKRTIGEILDSIRGLVEAICCVGFFVAYVYDRRVIAKMRLEESLNKDEQLKQQGRAEKSKKESTK